MKPTSKGRFYILVLALSKQEYWILQQGTEEMKQAYGNRYFMRFIGLLLVASIMVIGPIGCQSDVSNVSKQIERLSSPDPVDLPPVISPPFKLVLMP